MKDRLIDSISQLARETGMTDRENVPKMVAWIRGNRSEFKKLISSFDRLVKDYNLSGPEVALPTINQLLGENKWCPLFKETFEGVNQMMQNGEIEEPSEPFLNYHTAPIDTPALVAGGIFHIYDELLMRHPDHKDTQRYQSVDDLLIILSSHKENPLYNPVFNKDRLDWGVQ